MTYKLALINLNDHGDQQTPEIKGTAELIG